jgi:hypothetical protein
MIGLDELLAKLKADESRLRIDVDGYHQRAEDARHEANEIAARIRGIEEARAAVALQRKLLCSTCGHDYAEDGDEPHICNPPRRQRRRIQALVKEALDNDHSDAAEIASWIGGGCRKSQVEAALKKLEAERASERIAMGPLPGGDEAP